MDDTAVNSRHMLWNAWNNLLITLIRDLNYTVLSRSLSLTVIAFIWTGHQKLFFYFFIEFFEVFTFFPQSIWRSWRFIVIHGPFWIQIDLETTIEAPTWLTQRYWFILSAASTFKSKDAKLLAQSNRTVSESYSATPRLNLQGALSPKLAQP